jgi:RimJ/RimL family protein N-acetyltransferase
MMEPDGYPSELEGHVTLENHRRVDIRPLRPCEDAPIRDLYARLSPRTRYERFFSPMPALPDSVLRLLSCIDYRTGVALIVEDAETARPTVVAVGSVTAISPDSAEIAVVVQDEWQGHGVGTVLIAKLLEAAEARGFHRFVVSMLAENAVIRKLLHRFGRVIASTTRYGVSEVTFVRRVAH